MTTNAGNQRYVPALSFDWLTRFYDPLIRATMREEHWKTILIEQAHIEPGHHILDVGCGTGTLAIMVKRAFPQARVVGLDGDPTILAIACEKAKAAGVDVELHHGMAFAPPFGPATFDRVLSSLVFHHLTADSKRRTLEHIRAMLRPGGELHVADWGAPQNALMWLASWPIRIFDGEETVGDNLAGRLVPMMADAGFTGVAESHQEMTMFGTLSLYRATAPAA